jgi:hypothetical protein
MFDEAKWKDFMAALDANCDVAQQVWDELGRPKVRRVEELDAAFCALLDNTHGTLFACGHEFGAGDVVRKMSPYTFNLMFNDWLNQEFAEGWRYGDYISKADAAKVLDAYGDAFNDVDDYDLDDFDDEDEDEDEPAKPVAFDIWDEDPTS